MTSKSPSNSDIFSLSTLPRDLVASVVVFLVALPLCLGIALASGAPLASGLLAGIIGGIIVGGVSGSHTSVSGPAAGLTAIVAAQIAALGSFEAFLAAVALAGVLQIGLGLMRAGALSAFFPTSVIKGLLAAIGVILILKQIPHLVGHDDDPEGEMSFVQPDDETTITELLSTFAGEFHWGAAIVGLLCLAFLITWGKIKFLRESLVPGPLVVVLFGVGVHLALSRFGEPWLIGPDHLVQIPVADSVQDLTSFLTFPDFSLWKDPKFAIAAVTIAIVASLETLINIEAVDRLDSMRRRTPPSRELLAQGAGNLVAGLIGALPVTSVIIRGSVNVHTGAKTKRSAVFHGVLLLVCVGLFPAYLNLIPLSALAAILLVTGFKLASPQLFRQMWREGRYQFIPFITTLLAIVFTDLLIGILIGLAVSVFFILKSNLRRPIRRIVETHLDGDILHIELSNQVSFLNQAALTKAFEDIKPGTHVLIDASDSDYIDPDIRSLIRDFRANMAPAHDVTVSLVGFKEEYKLDDEILFADYSTKELCERASPEQVLAILQEGNRRFRTGSRLSRDFNRLVGQTAGGQHPLAVVLSCIDSRVPVELVFDLGLGDVFSARVAGNVVGSKTLASIDFAVSVAGVKLVLVLGHTRCGAITASLGGDGASVQQATGSAHLPAIVDAVRQSVKPEEAQRFHDLAPEEREALVDEVARRNVERMVDEILERSRPVREAHAAGKILVLGAIYDIRTGGIDFLEARELSPADS